MHHFFRNRFFDFEAIRLLGTARYGGSEVAEFLDAVGQIQQNNAESWGAIWLDQARHAEEIAREAEAHGQRAAARMAYLRASNYTRASAYMLTGDGSGASNSHIVSRLQKTAALFRKAARLFDGPVHELKIPFGDHTLPGYLYLPPGPCRLPGGTPLVVNLVGADSTQEEIYYTFPAAGPELGYSVFTFEGPGQGLTLHEHGIPMRPDWEVVTDAAMNYLMSYAEEHGGLDLDWGRVAIAGASLGGYFALRSAASVRFSACVAVDPLYDLYEFATKHVSRRFFDLWDKGWISDWFVDTFIGLGTQLSFQTRWEILTSAKFLGATTPTDLLRTMRRYTLRGHLDRIKCPVLVSGAADSLYLDAEDHTAVLFRGLTHAAKEIWVARKPGEGSLQAKVGAMALCNQRAFLFLDNHFGVKRGLVSTNREST